MLKVDIPLRLNKMYKVILHVVVMNIYLVFVSSIEFVNVLLVVLLELLHLS